MKPVKVDSFSGINNKLPANRMFKPDAPAPVRNAVNVDHTAASTFQRRPGYAKILELSQSRSLFSCAAGSWVATGSELHWFDADGPASGKVADLASSVEPVAYAESPLGVIWSDGAQVGVVNGDSLSSSLCPDAPNPRPLAIATTGGSLAKGARGLMFAAVTNSGVRSPFTVPQFISVADGGRIDISAPAHALTIEVFSTSSDGSVFHKVGSMPAGTNSMSISVERLDGMPIVYEAEAKIPGGGVLCIHNGRLLVGRGATVFYSDPWAMGIYRPAKSFITFPDEVMVMASVDAGVIVGTAKRHYLLTGTDVSKADMRQIAPYGAVHGTMRELPNQEGVIWFTHRGPAVGGSDGSMSLQQDREIAFDPALAGSAMVREENGLRQYVASMKGQRPSSAAVMGAYIEAETIKTGV